MVNPSLAEDIGSITSTTVTPAGITVTPTVTGANAKLSIKVDATSAARGQSYKATIVFTTGTAPNEHDREIDITIYVQDDTRGRYEKQPAEEITLSADFSDAYEIAVLGETISSRSSTVTATDESSTTGMKISDAIDGDVVKVRVAAGTDRVGYEVQAVADTSGGNKLIVNIDMPVIDL